MTRMTRLRPWPSNTEGKEQKVSAPADNSLGAYNDDSGGGDVECNIPRSALLRVLQGVAVATKTPDDSMEPVIRCISSRRIPDRGGGSNACAHDDDHGYDDDAAAGLPFCDWRAAIGSELPVEKGSRQLAGLALGVAFLREKCRLAPVTAIGTATSADLALVWGLIRGALTGSSLTRPLCRVFRSAQGFLVVPLCSLIKDGCIEEIFRLQVWLPDDQCGNPDFAIHSHQPFARGWILAGESTSLTYKVEAAVDRSLATHAEYDVAWNDGSNFSTTPEAIPISSIFVNTKMLVRATPVGSAVHARDMSYSIPAAAFNRTEVSPDILHATLSFFDSPGEIVKDGPVLGPKDDEFIIQLLDPVGTTPETLVRMIDAVRSWEIFMEQGQHYGQRERQEHALRAFNSALNVCDSVESFPNATRYRHLALGQLGSTNSRLGRHKQAKEILERALIEKGPSLQRVELSGELGVAYLHLNRTADAKRAFEIQYNTAKKLNFEREMCRAIGCLGFANYRLFQQNHDDALLDLAIEQLIESVQSARYIKETLNTQTIDPKAKGHRIRDATARESFGLSRLSACYAALGNAEEAITVALECVNIASSSENSTLMGVSRYFYGHALLLAGQHEEAVRQFNLPEACTAAIALCREPSEEHRGHLREVVKAGGEIDLVDEEGYTALDYAVFSGDAAMERIVLDGLRRRLDGDVECKIVQRQREAKLRKGYRELFQDKLRPVLLGGGSGHLQNLRRVYADALGADEDKRSLFDELKFVRYSDFLRLGKLPRWSDGLAQQFRSESGASHQGDAAEFVVFFSYRWINKDHGQSSPDDGNHSQYRRMIRAAEEFLRLHPSVKRERLSIWVVSQNGLDECLN